MVARVKHGACKLCGRGVVYQGAEYCSPACYGKAYGQRGCVLCLAPISLTQDEQVCENCKVPLNEQSDALISPCGKFRYVLTRIWGPPPWILFVGLNPSVADAEQDDPTVRWWRRYAKQKKFGGFLAVNLFGFRATDPEDLKAAGYLIGPDNDAAIEAAAQQCEFVAGCWGSSGGTAAHTRIRSLDLFRKRYVFCFGVNQDGHPRHPLARGENAIAPDVEPVLWSSPANLNEWLQQVSS